MLRLIVLFNNFRDNTGTDGLSTFPDCESELFFHRDRFREFHGNLGIVAGHNHFDAFREIHLSGYVSCAEIELYPVKNGFQRPPSSFVRI